MYSRALASGLLAFGLTGCGTFGMVEFMQRRKVFQQPVVTVTALMGTCLTFAIYTSSGIAVFRVLEGRLVWKKRVASWVESGWMRETLYVAFSIRFSLPRVFYFVCILCVVDYVCVVILLSCVYQVGWSDFLPKSYLEKKFK